MAANLDRAETSLTAVSDIAYIRGIDGSGNSVRISKADLANVLGVYVVVPGTGTIDLNEQTTPGHYFIRDSAVINAPHTSWGFLFVLSSNQGYFAQFWLPDNEDKIYYRRKPSGSWTNWLTIKYV